MTAPLALLSSAGADGCVDTARDPRQALLALASATSCECASISDGGEGAPGGGVESVDESVAFGAPADEAATHDVAGAESAGAGASSDTAAATLPICALIGVAAHVAVGNGPVAAAVDTYILML